MCVDIARPTPTQRLIGRRHPRLSVVGSLHRTAPGHARSCAQACRTTRDGVSKCTFDQRGTALSN